MMLANRRFDQIALDDINALVDAAYAEAREIDFKRELPDFDGKKPDDARKKFLADVASLANAGGGDIVFGVEEGRDDEGKPNGIPIGVPGVLVDNFDALQRRWMGFVESGLDPRMAPKIRLKTVELPGSTALVLVLRVPRSYVAPHMVRETGRFHIRHGPENRTLDTAEIRAAFGVSEKWAERMRRFRDERLGRFLGGDLPITKLLEGPYVVIHGVPKSCLDTGAAVDLHAIKAVNPDVRYQDKAFEVRFNVDGLLFEAGRYIDRWGYLQILRDGSFEFAATIRSPNRRELLNLQNVERHIEHCAASIASCIAENGAAYPYGILVSLVGIDGMQAVPLQAYQDPHASVQRDLICLPDVVLEDADSDTTETLRPLADALSQSFGFERSATWGKSEGGSR